MGISRKAPSSNATKKILNYGNGLKDNLGGSTVYAPWVVNTTGYFKTTFDRAAFVDVGNVNKDLNISSGLGFVPNLISEFAVYVRITSSLSSMTLGHILNYTGSWANQQGGQKVTFESFPTGKWFKLPLTQTHLDLAKANTNYIGNVFLVFAFSNFTGTGAFEFMVMDTRGDNRANDSEVFAFSAESAGQAERAILADKSSVADNATSADSVKGITSPTKTILGSTSMAKSPSTVSTLTQTLYYGSNGVDKIGMMVNAVISDNFYIYGYARLTTDKTYDYFKTRKFRFVIKSDVDTICTFRLTNGSAWGSADGSLGRYYDQALTLNAANNRTAVIEIDYSSQTFADFYANAARTNFQNCFYIIAFQDGSTVGNGTYKIYSYAYEVTAGASDSDIVAEMNTPTVSDIAKKSDVDKQVTTLDTKITSAGTAVDRIVCWGDSLTAGGGWTTQLQTLTGLTVYNAGTGGENAVTIMARQGADPMIVNNITIPADTSEILLASRPVNGGFDTYFGKKATPLLQSGSTHVNPAIIDGIEGTLRWTGADYADMNGTWVWKRNAAGSAVTIDRPRALVTGYGKNQNTGIMIIFMGQNGGYADDAELINMHKLMIKHSRAKYVMVLGLSSGDATSRAAYETAMKKEFGRYFFSIREYLAAPIKDGSNNIISSYGLADAGITPTSQDLADIAIGKTPTSLLTDGTHYQTITKTVIGNALYKRMKGLGIVS